MRTLKHYTKMANAAFANRTKQYIDNGAKEVEQFQQWVANAFARYMESGDISHLNNMVEGSLAIQRFRTFIRVAKPVSCHEYDAKTRTFTGKIDSDKRDKLCEVDGDSGMEMWEAKLVEFFASEDEHQEKAPAKTWDVDAAILQLINKAGKNGVATTELAGKFASKLKEVASKAA
jgi:hypothetical protein